MFYSGIGAVSYAAKPIDDQTKNIVWVNQSELLTKDAKGPNIDLNMGKIPLNSTMEKLYPGLILLNSSKSIAEDKTGFDIKGTISDTSITYKKSKSNLQAVMSNNIADRSESALAALSNVYITGVGYYWYLIQDNWYSNQITIYNSGSLPVSGIVIIWSWEDGYGYAAPFYDLAPYATTIVSVPFQVINGVSSVGKKPLYAEVRVDPGSISTHLVQLPTDGIEVYNNAIQLADPDGGVSLATSDLNHPYNYTILMDAATAGDNTYAPYATSSQINTYVYQHMGYDFFHTEPYYHSAASDLYLLCNGYFGDCTEFAALFVSYERALHIPARYYAVTYRDTVGQMRGHAISEIWNGTNWIHADQVANVFNGPGFYKALGYTQVHLYNMYYADDSVSASDPYGDLLLDPWNDFSVVIDMGEPAAYN
jgi:Transglutaminase-like enzymes, putative cysteine proteases